MRGSTVRKISSCIFSFIDRRFRKKIYLRLVESSKDFLSCCTMKKGKPGFVLPTDCLESSRDFLKYALSQTGCLTAILFRFRAIFSIVFALCHNLLQIHHLEKYIECVFRNNRQHPFRFCVTFGLRGKSISWVFEGNVSTKHGFLWRSLIFGFAFLA